MAKKNGTHFIKVINKDGSRTTRFNREYFLRMKPDREGYRSGWKPFEGEIPTPTALRGGRDNASSNVPAELKTFKPKPQITDEEIQRRIDEGIQKGVEAALAKVQSKSTESMKVIDHEKEHESQPTKPEDNKNSAENLPKTGNEETGKASDLKNIQERVSNSDKNQNRNR